MKSFAPYNIDALFTGEGWIILSKEKASNTKMKNAHVAGEE